MSDKSPSILLNIEEFLPIIQMRFKCGPSFMALLTVSTELALMEAGNSVLTASVFYRLACVLGVTRHSLLTRLVQRNWALACKRGIVIVSAEFGGK